MRLCASLLRGVAAPLGCVIFFCSCQNCGLYTLRSVLSECARRGVVYQDGRLDIIFGGGYLIEEHTEKL